VQYCHQSTHSRANRSPFGFSHNGGAKSRPQQRSSHAHGQFGIALDESERSFSERHSGHDCLVTVCEFADEQWREPDLELKSVVGDLSNRPTDGWASARFARMRKSEQLRDRHAAAGTHTLPHRTPSLKTVSARVHLPAFAFGSQQINKAVVSELVRAGAEPIQSPALLAFQCLSGPVYMGVTIDNLLGSNCGI
jgi:hypothetical protein